MKWNKSWAAWPVNNYRITIVITALMLAFGLYGMYKMPKDEFPAYTVRQGLVVAVMPGATSEEVEAQVAKPLERYLFTYKEVLRKKTTTTSQNGMCLVMVQLQDYVNNKDEVWSKLKHGLNTFKSQLPSGVVALIVNDDFGDACALLITVESQQRSYRELQQYSDELADRLRRVKSVSNVRQYGEVKEQLTLYVDRERLASYGIGQAALMQAINGQGVTTMAGSVTGGEQNIQLHVSPTQNSEEELMNQIVFSSNNKIVRVRDIATVKREYDTSESYVENNGNRCVLLSLEMNAGNNIVAYGEQVDKVISEFKQDYLPDDVEIRRITDQPKVVSDSVHDFLRDLFVSMLIIVLVMMILFPVRSAIVAAITIPLSTFTSTGIMYAVGIPLNTITLACLIVVLGMIVDNSIVVIDGYLEYLGKGMGRRESAVRAVKQYFSPMMLATVCICAIFYPLIMTMRGEAHDVIQSFPATMTINLMVSLLVAVTVIPLLDAALIKKVSKPKEGKMKLTDRVQVFYEKCLKWTFKNPYLTMIGAVVLVILSSLIFPRLKMRQFPYADRNQFAVEIFLPEGEGLEHTREIADSMRNVLRRDKRVTSVTSFIGCSSPRFQVSYAPQIGGRNFAQLIVNTPDIETTFGMLNDYAPEWSNHWPNAYVRFKQMDFMYAPTHEYRFYGENLDSINHAAEMLMAEMRHIPGIEWVHTDYDQPHPIMEVNLDPVASAQLGINRTTAQLQLTLQTGEMQVGSIWEGDYEVPIVVKDASTQHMQLGDLGNTYLSTPMGQSLSLRQVAQVSPTWTQSKIVHRNGERCISVTAEGKRNVLAAPIQSQIQKIMKGMRLPQGVRSEVGGEVELNNEMLPQIAAGIGIALVIIFFFILFNFKRFGITVLCMVAIALSMPGALLGLWIANRTLGLTSLFGFITLMGIIMRNEILIFEHADQRLQEGWTAKDAAFDAGRRRMVPIFLTTATTAVGVIPMIIAGSSFWMPVGITIFAGGIGTLILVVTVLPVVYWKLNDKAPNNPRTLNASSNQSASTNTPKI
ncbi:MAG: efflux RND transporter permease subunit [Bacteroidaceae bacterium]|nr:efflux RND transporter permease subunit [Bacteroidaceae bacterium]